MVRVPQMFYKKGQPRISLKIKKGKKGKRDKENLYIVTKYFSQWSGKTKCFKTFDQCPLKNNSKIYSPGPLKTKTKYFN